MILVHALPPLVGAIGLAAVFSAEVSAADAVLFMLTTSLSQDLYKRFVNPAATDARVLRVARWTAVASGAVGVGAGDRARQRRQRADDLLHAARRVACSCRSSPACTCARTSAAGRARVDGRGRRAALRACSLRPAAAGWGMLTPGARGPGCGRGRVGDNLSGFSNSAAQRLAADDIDAWRRHRDAQDCGDCGRRHRQGSHSGGHRGARGGDEGHRRHACRSPTCRGAASSTCKHGRMLDDDGFERLAKFDAIYLGAIGAPTVPDHISVGDLLLPLRQRFHQYVNLRPMRLLAGPQLAARQPRPPPTSTWSACARTPRASTPASAAASTSARRTRSRSRPASSRDTASSASSATGSRSRRSGRARCSPARRSRTRCATRWCCGTKWRRRSRRRLSDGRVSASTTSTRSPRAWSRTRRRST